MYAVFEHVHPNGKNGVSECVELPSDVKLSNEALDWAERTLEFPCGTVRVFNERTHESFEVAL